MQYADDTQLYVALKDSKTLPTLTDCVRSVHLWLDTNGLSLNPDKTEVIILGTSARHRAEEPVTAVDIGAATVQTSHSVKSLVDDMLSFNQHVDNLCKQLIFTSEH